MKKAQLRDRLREAIVMRNMKAVDLCAKTGIPKSAISYYVAGKSEPRSERLYLLAKALDVSEAWLMGYDVEISRTETQKTNDTLSDIVLKLRSDKELMLTVEKLCQLDKEELEAINRMISAFKK